MISDRIHDLVTANPMLIEITRFRRRFFSFSTGNSMNSVVLTLCLIGYAIFVLFVMENASSTQPIYLVMIQTGLLTVLAPMMLYGSIASERERRSWDLLMAAPITKAQVVAGKFIGAMAALGIAVAMFLVPILIASFSYQDQDSVLSFGRPRSSGVQLVNCEFLSITFLMVVCSLTILFSARVKRGLMALGATLGILTFLLIVFPTIIAPGASSDPLMADVSMYFHPFYIMSRILRPQRSFGDITLHLPIFWGWIQSVVYFGLSIVLLGWAANTLHFAENEVKFLPQGEKNA